MKLSEFIVKLQEFEAQGYGDIPVKIADWQEGYREPSEAEAEVIFLADDFLCIGGN